MNSAIPTFLLANTVATVCCTDGDNKPYCFNCFYFFDNENGLLLFKSSDNSHHSQLLSAHKNIAGSILPNEIDFSALKGIQFTGKVGVNTNPDVQELYHDHFPVARNMPGKIWCVELEHIKLTDNTVTFGKKLHWDRVSTVRS